MPACKINSLKFMFVLSQLGSAAAIREYAWTKM